MNILIQCMMIAAAVLGAFIVGYNHGHSKAKIEQTLEDASVEGISFKFMRARLKYILQLNDEGKSDMQIACQVSLDADQVLRLRTNHQPARKNHGR